jgi:hypothetical protein
LTKTKEFIVKVIRIEQTDAEKLAADNAWLSDEIILYGNTALDNVTWDLSLPAVGPNGSTISWSSTNSDVIMTDETVIRPSYTLGDQSITLTAVISNGASATKTFIIIEKAAEPTDDEILNLDAEWLTIEKIQNGNTAYNNTDKIKICFDSTDIQFGEEFNRRCSGKKTGRLRQQLRGQTRIP